MPSACRGRTGLGWATIVVEWAGGALILRGAFVPVVIAPMLVVLVVAIVTVHLPYGFNSIEIPSYAGDRAHLGQPGYEADLLDITSLRALCVARTSPFVVAGAPKKRFARRRARGVAPTAGGGWSAAESACWRACSA
jgi:putative oxidoreductase